MSRPAGQANAASLMAELAALDVRLWAEGGSLRYDAPAGAFTPELKARVRSAKAELLALLAAAEPGPATAPLSSHQERMWFLNRLEGGADAYMESGAFDLRGTLDLSALRQALAWLVARHPVLRTVFRDTPDGSVQVIQPAGEVELPLLELTGLTPAARREALLEAIRLENRRPLDLAQGPVVRFVVYRFAADDHALGMFAHHAAWDGWSTGVFMTELGAAYAAFRRGGPPPMPPPATTYAAYAAEQRQRLADGSLTAEAQQWADRLAGLPLTPFLPADHPRPDTLGGRGAQLPVALSPELVRALTVAGRGRGATLTAVLLAAYGLLLARVSGRTSLLVGLPMAARERPELESVVGYFANTVPVRLDLAGAGSFAELVDRVRASLLEAISHQMVPLDHLIRVMAPPRSRSHSTLVQVLFNQQPRHLAPPALEGLEAGEMLRPPDPARYDLTLSLVPAGDGGLAGQLIYDADLFAPATAAVWRAEYLAILDRALAHWHGPLALAAAPVAPAFPLADQAPAPDYEPPASPTEERLAALWRELLKVDRVGRGDDFFLLGGHSLLLMRLVNRVDAVGLGRLDLYAALGETSLAGMAALLTGVRPAVAQAAAAGREAVEFPASPAQEGLYLERRDRPAQVTYSVPFTLPLAPGQADPALVRAALSFLVRRHDAMRMEFVERDGAVAQRLLPADALDLAVHDLGGDPGPAARLAAIARDDMTRPFDLGQGPLFRFALCLDGQGGGWLLGNADHIVFDGWSEEVLRREFAVVTAALAAGDEPSLPPAPLGYVQAMTAWRQRLAGPRGEELRAFWRDRVAGLELGELPADAPSGNAVDSGRRHLGWLSAPAQAALAELARRGRTTPAVAWTAAVAALMARYKDGDAPVAVGMPFANRGEAATEDLVGYFVNVLPVRLDKAGEQPLAALVAAARAELIAVMAHQDYPLAWLTADAAKLTGERPQALFDAVALVDAMPAGVSDLAEADLGAGKFPLMFQMFSLPGGRAQLCIEHDAARFSPGRVARMAAHLDSLLVQAAARPEVPVGELDILPAHEHDRVVEEFNRTARAYPRDESLATLFRAAAAANAQRPALVWTGGAMTYAELDRRSDAIAAGLAAAGAGRGDVVGLALARGADAVVATLAVVKAGAAYLPLDPGLPPALAGRLLADAGARLVAADAEGRARYAGGLGGLRIVDLDGLALAAPPPPSGPGGEAPAYVMFTSGTTGEPKGVVVPHRAVARLALNADFLRLTPDDAMAQAAPLGFDAATLEIWAPLLNGARVALIADADLMDPAALAERLAVLGVSAMWLTASLMNRLADENPACLWPLKVLMTGGEALSPPHLRRVMAACPGLRLINGYGPTENTTFTTTHALTATDAAAASAPIGRPIANTRVYVVDRAGNPAPIGVWGELLAAGDGLALGYAGRPDLTAAAFAPLAWLPGERLYRTGDLARWREDGVLEFGGRRDGQVKVRGHRVETAAVEAALAVLPGVREAAVLTVGQGAERGLVAVVAAETAREDEWRAALAAKLPDFMAPDRFLAVERLPVTANGKRDRRALAGLAASCLTPASAPRPLAGEIELLLARLFGELLPGCAIDAESDFFRLGGHSLLAMRLAGLIERETGRRPAVRDLMAARTLAGMAALVQAGRSAPPADDLPHAAGPDFPLASGQARLWVIQRLNPESAAYNVPLALDLRGQVDPGALAQALTALEERQHALRLRFISAPGDPAGVRQRLAAPGGLRLDVRDLRAAADPIAAAGADLAAEAGRPFRLEEEAPARAFLWRLGDDRWRLLLVLHHTVCDAWSLPVLWRDLGALYARALGRPGPELPPLARHYEDFASWQQGFLASAAGRELRERWRERLTPLPESLALPLDRPRPPVRGFRGGFVEHAFAPDLAQAVETQAQAAGATVFMVMLALLQALIHRHTGQTDLTLGTLTAGRGRAALHDLAGFFVNTLALRQRIDPAEGLASHLAKVRESFLAALADQDCPFEAVVEAAGAPRDTSRNPLFDVLAVWQDGWPAPPALAGVEAAALPAPFPFAKFDLGFYFHRQDGVLRVQVEFDADLFDRASVEALVGRLEHLASVALADPTLPLGDLPAMDPAERALVVEGFNATDAPLDAWRTIPAPFLERLAAAPDAPAVAWDEGNLTYARFAARAAAVAEELVAAGVKPGQVVALCARRSPAMLIGVHGILLAGAAYAPLDPDHPAARRAGMLADLDHPLVLAAPEHAGLFAGSRVLPLIATAEAAPGACPADPGGLAYVIFTSGSTGRPKGVMIEHHAAVNRIRWMQRAFPLGPGDVILQKTPITFDVSVWELFWWSWVGAAVALPPPGAERDPAALVAAVERHRVTVMHFVPSMLASFLAHIETRPDQAARLASLRYVFASGEALDGALVERFNRLVFAPHGADLHNLYGPTEAAVDVSWQPCSPWSGGAAVPIGKPIANTRLYVLDAALDPVPVGVTGEICIAGAQVGRGYINRPGLTAERFAPDPFAPGKRMYRTGDLGRWRRDGAIEYLGRGDFQVKVRGQRIELGEIEHALEEHPAIERAVVMAATVAGLTELHAYLLCADDLGAAVVRRHLRASLPEYMLPARYFRLKDLPLTSSGKVDRKALSGPPLDRPDLASPGPAAAALAPFEAEVLAIWRALLPGLEPGVRASFFDAGGNSLLMIRLHERLEARWPDVFSLAELFGRATVADQAARLDEVLGQTGGARAAAAAPAGGGAGAGPVAIVGMAVRLAGGNDLDDFWRDLAAGADRVRPLPPDRQAEARALLAALGRPAPAAFREAAYLDDIYGFDPRRLGLAPADAALIDPEQRLFWETATAALEDAGYGGRALAGRPVGVFVGAVASPYYREAAGRLFPERAEQIFTLNVPSNVATRLSFRHDWRGPAAVVDTACSAALAAVHLACRAIASGDCEVAVAGAAKAILIPPDAEGRFTIDSSNARTRAFAEGADGTGMGEGAVVFLLKPLARALADDDPVHAVILGSAMNQDGAGSGMAAPNPLAQAAVVQAAARAAGVDLSSLSYFEAHGTGTALGDPVEIEGLRLAFDQAGGQAEPAAIGAVKGNYGHLDAAAGGLGLAKAVLCLAHDAAPPQPFFTAPNPRIDFSRAPVRVPVALTPLDQRGGPRRAGVSSFGLSGINVHVVLEAAPAPSAPGAEAEAGEAWWILGLSAASEADLRRYADRMQAALRGQPGWSLAAAARTLAAGRDHLPWRAAVAAKDREGALAGLDELAGGGGRVAQAPARRPEHASAPVPARAGDHGQAQAAADAFLGGADLAWPAGLSAGRLRLPAAPFTRQTCRPDFAAASGTPAWLGPAVATPEGAVHALALDSPGYWPLAEHRLNGAPVLVGMAWPGIVAAAARAAGLGPALALHDLRWLRPLGVEAIAPGSTSVSLLPEDGAGGMRAVLGARERDGGWREFAVARVGGQAQQVKPEGLAEARARCTQPMASPAFNPEAGAIAVSRRWDCRGQAWLAAGGDEALAELALPAEFSADLAGQPLHPALLDVAASLALDGPGPLPAGCAAIGIAGPLPTAVLAHVRRRRLDALTLEADLTIYDPSTGAALIGMTGLRFVGRAQAGQGPQLSRPDWLPTPLAVSVPDGPLAVVGEGELARRVADHLGQAGRLAGFCPSAAPEPDLLAALLGGQCAGLVLAPAGGADLAWRSAAVLRALLARLARPLKVLVAGYGAYGLGGSDAASLPDAALLAGLTLAAAQEEPLLAMRYVDADPAAPAAAVAAEFAAFATQPDGLPPLALLRGGQRYLPALTPLEACGRLPAWPDHGCCVVTGGLGGFALTLAGEMAAGGKVSLALISRRGGEDGDPAEAAWRRTRLGELAAAGVRVGIHACDVADRAQLAACLARIRAEQGPITAVAHAAGVADGSFLVRRRADEFQAALAAKVDGARHLDELTRDDPLRAFVLFSSIAAIGGAPGQAAYAAANAFLDAFARWRLAQGRPALAIDWCALESVGMAARSRLRSARDIAVSAEGAAAIWRAALAADQAQVVAAPATLMPRPDQASAATPARLVAVPPPAGDLAMILAAIWAAVLGYDRLGPEDDFFALGGDSITGMQAVNRIVDELGLPATLALLFENPSPAALAAALDQAGPAPAVGLEPAPAREAYPVAWEQLAVLRAEAAAEMGTAFNLPNLVDLPEGVDQARLEAALTALAARHEILRTRFIRQGDEFLMAVLPPGPVALPMVALPGGQAAYDAARERVRPFDLFAGEPVRLELLALADGRRWLLLDIHHALADGLSVELLVEDLAALYAGQAGPPPRLTLKDYAWHSREGAGAEKLAADRAYWLERFAGDLPRLDLPADRPRPARHTWRGDTVSFALEAGLLASLRAYAASRKATTFSVVLAAWAALAHRLTASGDVVIAVPVDARDHAGLAGVPGMLVSLLPLRLSVRGGDAAAALVARAQAVHAEALGHRAYNLGQLLADLKPPAEPERTLLSEITLSYMNFAEAKTEAAEGGAWRLGGLTRASCKNDLGVFIRDTPGRMLVSLEYYADLFDRERIERLGGQFRRLLAGLVGGAQMRVDRLPLLDEAERVQLEAWGRGARPETPLDAGLFDLLARAAEQRPQAMAVEQTGRGLTYAELLAQARAVASGLMAAGTRPGDFVAVRLERGCDAVAVLAGILAAGAAYVPLDPAYPAERNRFILADAGCALLVADAGGRAALGDAPGAETLAAEELVAGPDAAGGLPRVDGAWPAYIMYTSGSTGQPKGAVVPQRAVTRLVLGDDYVRLGPNDHVLQAGPLAFDASTFEIWGALLNGGRLYAASREEVLDPAALGGLVRDWGATALWLTAGLFNRQAEHDPASLAGLRALVTGGEAMSPRHAGLFLDACPGTELFNGYGPTENTTFTAVHRVRAADVQGVGVPIGRPVPHTEVRVLEPGGEPAPIGVWGEIHAGGAGLADGYWRRPELTAEKFVPDPAGHGRLYRTGDRGRWRSDGVLEYGGRRDSQVKLRGLRIELEEIERALAGHPAVGRAVVMLAPDPGGEPALVAALIPAAEGVTFDAQALRRWLGRRLPGYMIPARIAAVAEIPVTANGKVDREALLARLARADVAGESGGRAPLTPAERLVAEVFSEVFGRPVNDCRLGFLDLGGHSLMAIKVVNRLAERTGVRLSMADFYAAASLTELAGRLEGALPPALSSIPPAPPAELYPVSHSQQRLYLLHHLEGGSGAYNMAFAFLCDGSLDASALAEALAGLVRRHEPLRTGFVERDGEIYQRVAAAGVVPVAVDDLRGSTRAWDEALRLARREVTAPFDLARPPLMRARMLCLDGDESVALLVLHHIVGDGWSSRILAAELGDLYAAAQDGGRSGLKPLPLTYKDYAAWQKGQDWGDSAAYWRQRLAGAPERVDLIGDRPRPEAQSFRGATCRHAIPAEVMDGLRAWARRRGVGMSAVGMAIFAALLYRLTRQADMVLGMGVAGRDRTELEGLIGFFVNVLPIRLRLDEATELDALVDQTHAAIMAALERRDYPFDRLVRDVAPPRQGNRQPLINVVFEYQAFGRLAADGPGLPVKAGDPARQRQLRDLIDSPTAKHDLLLFFVDDPGRVELQLEYDTDILDAATAERWLGYYARFAEKAARAALAEDHGGTREGSLR